MAHLQDFVNEFNLVIDTSKTTDDIIFLRSTMKSEEEIQTFLRKFSAKTNTDWIYYYGIVKPQRVIFHKAWVCHRSPYRKPKRSLNYRPKRNLNCQAKIDALIKKVNRSTAKNDAFLKLRPPLRCRIRMQWEHSEACYQENALRKLRVTKEVKMRYFSYFNEGFSAYDARIIHEDYLEKKDKNLLKSSHFNPTPNQVSYLYSIWRDREKNLKNRSPLKRPLIEHLSAGIITVTVKELLSAIPRQEPPQKKLRKEVTSTDIAIPNVTPPLPKVVLTQPMLNYVIMPQIIIIQQPYKSVILSGHDYTTLSANFPVVVPHVLDNVSNFSPAASKNILLPISRLQTQSAENSNELKKKEIDKNDVQNSQDILSKENNLSQNMPEQENSGLEEDNSSPHSVLSTTANDIPMNIFSHSEIPCGAIPGDSSCLSEVQSKNCAVSADRDMNSSVGIFCKCSKNSVVNSSSSEYNEDQRFFLSLLPELGRLPAKYKSDLKSKIQKLLINNLTMNKTS